MAQAHFIEVMQEGGATTMVRVDRIEIVEPLEAGGLRLHTPSGVVDAPCETRDSLKALMQSAQIILVPLVGSRKFPQKAEAPPAPVVEAPAPKPKKVSQA